MKTKKHPLLKTEKRVLGAWLSDPNPVKDYVNNLTDYHWSIITHKEIYDIVREFSNTCQPIDSIVVCEELLKRGVSFSFSYLCALTRGASNLTYLKDDVDALLAGTPNDNVLNINIKRLSPDAVIPSYANKGDAGMDLTSVSKGTDEHGNVVYGTGLAFEIPEGYTGLIFPRSSNCKKDVYLTNSVGVIDSCYRGEVMLKYRPVDIYEDTRVYDVGDRVGQIIILPHPFVRFHEVDELSQTERGTGGYGSTGK